MSKHIDFTYQKVGHVIMLEEDDWNRIVEYLQTHNLTVKEKSAKQSVHRTGQVCTCGGVGSVFLSDGREYCNICKKPRN